MIDNANVQPPHNDHNPDRKPNASGCREPASSPVKGNQKDDDGRGSAPKYPPIVPHLLLPPGGGEQVQPKGVGRKTPAVLPSGRTTASNPVTGEVRRVICRRQQHLARWSVETHGRGGLVGVQRRSYLTRPPTHFIRVTVQDERPDEEKAALVKKFRRSLRRSRFACEYLGFSEWASGQLHDNLLVIARGLLTPTDVAQVWDRACPGVPRTYYSRPVYFPVRIARYAVKDVAPDGKHGHKRELPPADCKVKRLVCYSTGFFTAPPRVLWEAQKDEWRERTIGGRPNQKRA